MCQKMLWGRRRGVAPSLPSDKQWSAPMKRDDLSRSLVAFDQARLSCFLKFDVNESSFSGSKVEFQAASFDLLVYSVESLTKRGGESGRWVEDIGELGAE